MHAPKLSILLFIAVVPFTSCSLSHSRGNGAAKSDTFVACIGHTNCPASVSASSNLRKLPLYDDASAYSFAIDPLMSIYASDGSSFVYRSPDEGATWSVVFTKGGELFSSGDAIMLSGPVSYRTTNGGIAWEEVGDLSERGNTSSTATVKFDGRTYEFGCIGMNSNSAPILRIDVSSYEESGHLQSAGQINKKFIFLPKEYECRKAKLFVFKDSLYFYSPDGEIYRYSPVGGEWASVGFAPRGNIVAAGDVLLDAAKTGIYSSADLKEWKMSSSGLREVSITKIVKDGESLFAISAHGFYRSDDLGATWKDVSFESSNNKAAVPQNINNISDGTLKLSTDWGIFSKVTGFTGEQYWALADAVRIGGRTANILNSVSNGAATVVATDMGVYVKNDADIGASWSMSMMAPGNIYSMIAANDVFFIGQNDGIYMSMDGGKNWQPTGTGVSEVKALFYDESSGVIYAGTSDGILKSIDLGVNWERIALAGEDVLAFAKDTIQIFAATNKGIYKSDDSGKTWASISGTIVENGVTAEIKSMVSLNGILYIGTSFGLFSMPN